MSQPPRLSVVVFTNGPVRLVAAALAPLRSVAHEVIVAADAGLAVEDLGALQAVADRVVRAEFEAPLEANLAWLHSLATGEWVLRLDSDDLVGDALLTKLATPGWDRGITHAYLQYRWVVDDGRSMLAQGPWWPDPVLRLVRNDPGLVRFGHGTHELPDVAGPHQLWDEPIYHLDLVVRSAEERAAKVGRYERERPGLRTDRGWSLSPTYYLPERFDPPPERTALEPVDAARVRQVLASAASHEPLPPTDEAALGPVVRLADRLAPAPAEGDARLRVVGALPLVLVEGRGAVVTVGVTNRTPRTWHPGDEPASVVGGRLFDAEGSQIGFEVRAPLTGPLAPGVETLVRVPLPPGVPRTATELRVGLVQDGVAWHDASCSVPLAHHRGRRVLVSTGISATPHLGDDLITDEVLHALATHLPDAVPILLAHPAEPVAARFGIDVATRPVAVAPTTSPGRRTEPTRRSRDLVAAARRMAKGEPPDDPAVAEVLAPFASASALVLAPGGGLASRYAEEALLAYAVEALVARAFGVPVLIEGPSVGPIETRRDQAALAELLNEAARLTVRDPGSADAARRIGRAVEPLVVADPATAALATTRRDEDRARAWRHRSNIPDDRPYAVISLRGGADGPRHLAAARAAIEALPEPTARVFLPHCTDDPDDDDHAVLDDPWLGAHLVPFDASLGRGAAVALVAGAEIAIGTRFHLSVLAAAAGVRAVGLTGDDYDRLRLRGLRAASGVRRVDVAEPEAAAAAVAELLASPAPEPTPRWDGEAFATALGEVLPPAPPLG